MKEYLLEVVKNTGMFIVIFEDIKFNKLAVE